MFNLNEVRIIACEEKAWSINGKEGKFYPTTIRIGSDIFNVTSKVDLIEYIDTDVSLVVELQAKTPKTGNPYTGIRITGIV